MNKAKSTFLGLLTLLLVTIMLLFDHGSGENNKIQKSLDFYCAAGMKLPVAAVVVDYEKEFDVKINVIYGGSGSLLSNIAVFPKGDLYLAADFSYIALAREKGLLSEALPVTQLRAGLAVAKGNPHKIHSLQDILVNDDLKIGLANPDAASIGKFTKEVLTEHKVWEAISQRVQDDGVFTGTVNELTNNLKLNSIDVAIVWDAVAAQYPEIFFVSIPEFNSKPKNTTIGILKSTQDSALALHFSRYLTAKNKGLIHFENMGYTIIAGDEWQEEPNE